MRGKSRYYRQGEEQEGWEEQGGYMGEEDKQEDSW